MDMASISSAITGIKATKEIFSAILNAKIEASVKEKMNEALEKFGNIQETLFELREELEHLQSENVELKKKLKGNENWEKRLTEYQLQKTAGGAVVYAFKGEPKHYACPSCVERKEIHILQDRRVVSGSFKCPGCDKTFPINQEETLPSAPIFV